MILSIYAIETQPIMAVKAIREALRVLSDDDSEASGPRPGLKAAKEILDAFQADGVAMLGETDSLFMADSLTDALRENGVYATTGSPERAKRLHEAEKMRAAGATPEEQIAALAPGDAPEDDDDDELPAGVRPDAAAASALALMQFSEGNPVLAGAYAMTLARAQGEASYPMWKIIQRHIIATFPWVEHALRENNALIS